MIPCLICLKNVPERNLKANKDEFSDLFQILCKHMKWTPREQYNFDFQKEDFPFCKDCQATLVTLHEYNELLESIQERINRRTSNLVTEILQTKNKNLDGFSNEEISDEDSSQVVPVSHKVGYYRNIVFRRYCPSLKLDDAWRNSLRGKLNGETDWKQKEKQNVSAKAPDCRKESMDLARLGTSMTVDEMTVADCYEIEFDDGDEGGEAGNAEELEEETGHMDEEEERGDNVDLEPGTSPDFQDDDLECKPEEDKSDEESQYMPLAKTSKLFEEGELSFRKSVHKDRIRPLGNNKFLFDNKDTFEYNSEGSWTCCTCGRTMFKSNMMCHLAMGHIKRSRKQPLSSSGDKIAVNKEEGFVENTEEEFVSPDSIPFRFTGQRLKKVGDFRFLLDDNCLFECSRSGMRCISCDIIFPSKKGLRQHLNVCPGGPSSEAVETLNYIDCIYDKLTTGEFQCRYCKILYACSEEMISHLKEIHVGKLDPTRRFETWCAEVEPNKFVCNGKFYFEFIEDEFKCGTCSTSFDTRPNILSHIQTEHLIPGFKRNLVHFTNPSPGKFIAEGFSFEQKGINYQCDHCEYSCSKLPTMKDHTKRIHINANRFPCETCGRRFSDRDDLSKHKVRHKDDRPFVCELCGKSFKLRSVLRSHIALIHPETSEKKFYCETCGEVFGTMALLRLHTKSHEVVVCDVCGKEVNGKKMYYHMARHAEETECKVCGKKFLVAANLITHEMAHAGKKPFSCDICNMTFTRADSLKKHKRVIHNPDKATKTYSFKKNTIRRSWKELKVSGEKKELGVEGDELPEAAEDEQSVPHLDTGVSNGMTAEISNDGSNIPFIALSNIQTEM